MYLLLGVPKRFLHTELGLETRDMFCEHPVYQQNQLISAEVHSTASTSESKRFN